MTVKELIAELEKLSPDATVVYDADTIKGYCTVTNISADEDLNQVRLF